MWCAALKRATEAWPPWVTQMANVMRAPTPTTHRKAAVTPALAKAPPARREMPVVIPASAPRVPPTRASVVTRTRSLPAVGTVWRNWEQAQTVMTTGNKRRARVMLWPRI